MAFAVCIQRKSTVFPVFLFLAFIAERGNVAFECRSFASSRVALSFESSLLSTFLKAHLLATSLAHKGCGYPIFCTELSVGIIGIYGIGSHTSYPYIHKLLLHADDQSFKRIPSLNALGERCSMNDMPSILALY